jgi:hypothetical protein
MYVKPGPLGIMVKQMLGDRNGMYNSLHRSTGKGAGGGGGVERWMFNVLNIASGSEEHSVLSFFGSVIKALACWIWAPLGAGVYVFLLCFRGGDYTYTGAQMSGAVKCGAPMSRRSNVGAQKSCHRGKPTTRQS